MNEKKPETSGRWTLPALFLLFAAPAALSWWLLSVAEFDPGDAGASHGELIVPPRPLEDMVLKGLVDPEATGHLHGKWTLVSLQQGVCNRPCLEQLYKMRQIRLATGKYARRVQRLLVVDGPFSVPGGKRRIEAFQGQLIYERVEDRGALMKVFETKAGGDPMEENSLYLIDPLGNLMMRYAPGTEPTGIIKDLKRLLRYSRIG